MTANQISKALKGRRIVKVEMRAFRTGRGEWAYNPLFVLDNGSVVAFAVQETDGDYGVCPVVVPKAGAS